MTFVAKGGATNGLQACETDCYRVFSSHALRPRQTFTGNQMYMHFLKKIALSSLCFLFLALVGGIIFPPSLQGQITPDDSVFHLKKFDPSDIKEREPEASRQILAANRIPEDSDDLPVRTFVITREEILANGFSTLVDVLKTLPGFHTSQPGDAKLGETFMMRGMLGNVYAKIMVNSVPLSPSAAPGMALAAQLPIKQAERIEIILGPASTLYGNDAMAGVINIVLPEVNRPLTATGNVEVGTDGLTAIHLALGGMLGKRENVVKYNFFGSTRRIKNMNPFVPWGDTLLRIDTAALTQQDIRVPRDRRNGAYADIESFNHESRVVGLSTEFRGLRLTAMGTSREDHSGLGTHPENIAYHDPNTKNAEYSYSLSAQYQKEIIFKAKESESGISTKDDKKLFMFTNANYLRYRIDENSSYEALLHPIVRGRNFIYAESDDFLLEQLLSFTINKNFSILGGGSMTHLTGTPYMEYLDRPYSEEDTVFDRQNREIYGLPTSGPSPNAPPTTTPGSIVSYLTPFQAYARTDWGIFSQAYFRSEWFNVVAGIRADRIGQYQNSDPQNDEFIADTTGWVYSPRVGGTFKVKDKFRLRGMYTLAFRRPGSYYTFNYYSQAPRTNPTKPVPFVRDTARLELETISNLEFGFTWNANEYLKIEGHYYNHLRKNSLFPQISYLRPEIAPPTDPDTNRVGFTNLESESRLQCIQGLISYQRGVFRMDLSGQYNWGYEFIEQVDSISDGYRSVPDWMVKANVHVDIPKIIRISVYGRVVGPYLGGITLENETLAKPEVPGFYGVDLVVSKTFMNKLQTYVKINNLTNSDLFTRAADFNRKGDSYNPRRFNNVAKGIFTNALTGNDMDYIPQLRTMVIVGLTYSLY